MTEEEIEEKIILLNDFAEGKIEKDKLEIYTGGFKMGYFYARNIQEAIDTVLKSLEQKDKEIDSWKKYSNEQEESIVEKNNKICDMEFKIENQQKALEQKDKMIKKAYIEANNVLYFDDDSDYCSALWTILHTLNPDLEEYPELSYIEESEEET